MELSPANEECLVGVRDHRAPTESLSFVHTARRSYRLGRTGELSGLPRPAWREAPRACLSGGRRSRNKAAVGEPAAGSFASLRISRGADRTRSQRSTGSSGPLGSGVDEERRTERDWWRRASALCESSLFECEGATPRAVQRRSVGTAGLRAAPGETSGPPCAGRGDGPNLSISVSPGGESKGGSRSSGERKGRSRARAVAGVHGGGGERSGRAGDTR